MTEEYKARKLAYIKKYQRKIYTNVSFKIRTETNKDILDKLASVPNKSEYIINLIRKDIYGAI